MWRDAAQTDGEEGIMSRGENDLYPIQPDQGYFDAGTASDGRQALMGLYCPDLVAIAFDQAGDLLGCERRHLEFLHQRGGVYDIYDERIPPRLLAWQEEMGFRSATIRVRRFFLDDLWIDIEDYPDHFGEILEDPEALDEEHDENRGSMRTWDAEGQFVLLWGNDYWLDGTGEVVSS
jgi:hypothetical protein